MSEKTKFNSVAPNGYVLIPKGGRPSKLSRDVAVFLARTWRMKCLKETAKKADDWIIENFPGLTESANVRAAIRRVNQKTFLNGCDFAFNEAVTFTDNKPCRVPDQDRVLCEEWLPFERLPSNFNLSKCAIAAFDGPKTMQRGAIWGSGMREAQLVKLVHASDIEQKMNLKKHAIGTAVGQLGTAN